MNIPNLTASLSSLSMSLLIAGITIVLALAAHCILFWILKRIARNENHPVLAQCNTHFRKLSLVAFLLLGLQLALPLLRIESPWTEYLGHFLSIAWMVMLFWAARQGLIVFEAVILERFQMGVADNLRARKIHTQIQVLKKVVYVVLAVIAGAVILMSFKGGRNVGASLLASAGIAGLIIGMAAQRTLGNLLAGIQIAFTQPIRLDDVVVVEGEWGRIEDITLTYVVVRIWDLRRLILPISYFLENPFQNWTRVSADILGTVVLPLDYTVPLEELRTEYKRLLDDSEDWDGQVWNVQVTDSTDRAMTVRLLMSAPDSGTAWMLRCHIREKMIEWIQRNYPEALPRLRAEVSRDPGQEPTGKQPTDTPEEDSPRVDEVDLVDKVDKPGP
ncbi:MAG: mechanosensitive ion channel family protein [Desulfovibrionales bacterium]